MKPLLNKKDLIPQCDGFKSISECCWFKGYKNSFHGGRFP